MVPYYSTDGAGEWRITCTLSLAGTVEVTALSIPRLPSFIYPDAPAFLNQPLTAAANITGKGCLRQHMHAMVLCVYL